MTIKKFDVRSDNIARFSTGNAWGLLPVRNGEADPTLGYARSANFSEEPIMLQYITATDRAYIAHDIPEAVVRNMFASGVDRGVRPRIDWEGIAIGAFLAGYLLLDGAVIFKVAAFGSLFVS